MAQPPSSRLLPHPQSRKEHYEPEQYENFSGYVPQLKKLLISFNYVDEGCCKVMMRSKWPELTHLDLGHTQIRDKGCYYLSKAEWPHLGELILSDNCLTPSGLKFLRKGNFPLLSSLDLNQNQIKQTGCVHVSKFPQKLRTSFANMGSWKLNNKEKVILSKGQKDTDN